MAVKISKFTQKIQNSDTTFSYITYYFKTVDRAVRIDDDISNGPKNGTNLHTVITEIYQRLGENGDLASNAYKLAKGVSSSFVFSDTGTLCTGLSSNVGSLANYTLQGDISQPGFKVGDNLFVEAKDIPDFWISQISTKLIPGKTGDSTNLKSATNGSSFVLKWGGYYVKIVAIETKTDLSGYAINNDIVRDYIAKASEWTIKGDDVSGSGTFSNGLTLTLKDVGTSGIYSAVKTDSKGRVVKGQQMVVFASSKTDTTLDKLAEGGIAIIAEDN